MHEQTGELYLVREIDLESLSTDVINLQIQVHLAFLIACFFFLQIEKIKLMLSFSFLMQATQIDNPLRQALSRVDVHVIDINDNQPEFEYDMYNITVMENLPVGFTVLQASILI